MWRRRLLAAVVTLLGAIVFLFVIIKFVPGDLASILLGPRATPELRAQLIERMGLDRSVPEQIWRFFRQAVTGDLGTDVLTGRPILHILADVLPATLQLAGAALVISMALGILLGAIAALRPGTLLDSVLGVASVAFITTPGSSSPSSCC